LPYTDFETALQVQLIDWERLASLEEALCIAGDFNLSLGDSSYVTKTHRRRMIDCLEKLRIEVPTRGLLNNVDQIAISSSLLNSVEWETETWHKNKHKNISDHHGIWLTLKKA
jgi:endonuclease/exonuclease/phosphatase family metal-dependent hydrolase